VKIINWLSSLPGSLYKDSNKITFGRNQPMEPKWLMRSVATPTWSPRAPAARWRTRRRRVGARGGPHLRKDLRCDTVHRPTRWWTRGSTGEAGRRGMAEVSVARGEGEAVDLWLKRDGR
jgi:hypothetical protein